MNEKLKDILTTLYNEPEKLHASCVENLVNKSLPNVNFGATYSTLGTLANVGTYSIVDFADFIKRQYLSNIDDYQDKINNSLENYANDLKNLSSAKSFCDKVTKLAKAEGIESTSFISNLKEILKKEENSQDLYSPIISALILSNLEEKDLDTYGKIDKFATLIIIALVDAGENKNLPQNVEELRNGSLDIIGKVFPNKEEDAKTLLNNYTVFSALAETTNSAVAIRCKAKYTQDIDYDDDAMMYYENCEAKPLISNDKIVAKGAKLIDELKKADLLNDSYVISFALGEIEKTIRANGNLPDAENILISQITFLTLCDQLNVNVDDKVLFAFANPILEFEHTINNEIFKQSIEISKNITNEILGKDKIDFDDIYKYNQNNINNGVGNNLQNVTPTQSTSFIKQPKKVSLTSKFMSWVKDAVAKHGTFMGIDKEKVKKGITKEQISIHSSSLNSLSLSSVESKIVKKVNKDVDPKYYSKNLKANTFIEYLVDLLKDLYAKLDKQRQLVNQKAVDLQNGIISQDEYDKIYENYKKTIEAKNLKKILKDRINNEVYRKMTDFGDDYSDNYK